MEPVKKITYPGRLIIIGKTADNRDMALYAITGRSPSSQARRLKADEGNTAISVEVTNQEILEKGNPELLVYRAVILGEGIAIGNGKQTEDILEAWDGERPATGVLSMAMREWEYEPDPPNFTPRITGCVFDDAALAIIKRGPDGDAVRESFEVPAEAGKGKMIATYAGPSASPLPSFSGGPVDVDLPYVSAAEAAEALYEALGPESGAPDLRVTAAAVIRSPDGTVDIHIKNRF